MLGAKIGAVTERAHDTSIHRAARSIFEKRQVDDFLYGALVSGSILAVSSAHAEDSRSVLLATGLVNLTYWLAHVYVDAVGGGSTMRITRPAPA